MEPTRHCMRTSQTLLRTFTSSPARDTTLPAFLVPALAQRPQQTSRFSTSSPHRSKIGRAPLSLPPGVTFKIQEAPQLKDDARVSRNQPGSTVEIEGPLGKMTMQVPAYVNIRHDEETRTHTVRIVDQEDKKQKAMWGTVRAYLQNHILGVSEGHAAILRLVGVGYRATIESSAVTKKPEYPGQQFVSLKVGYSHPIEMGVPQGVKASTPQPTRILLEGVEKEVVMQFAAEIRAWRRPEPYKGKGIFVNDETIKLKAKKIK
ncbi:hypothetical protein M409DRAFT_69206 [Zasmidium cellare ATCC 36951]|uniref:Large ribosomal subunit protein uL6 alpha-beta domain-containing protein n=1 Tax=Zasmidium cellare ATCC 36951 TaxID=1080233 RepID=A0A6A6C5H7_ZASCE|nr:uncharacterized protein M409DRAFT_69206 [Zasmidium cellare ATCC 36951]KAF2162301.1 hypothetical protein M409DRAFT_69206 [Zasmidium cellare ATCC 36951]